MTLEPSPDSLRCSECGEELADTGYLPARKTGDGYEPIPDAAVCGPCGFNEIGMMGCAPELDEVVAPETADSLLYVRPTAEGFEVVSVKS